MSMYFIEEADEMELSDVAQAIEEAGFGVGATRVRQALAKLWLMNSMLIEAERVLGLHMDKESENGLRRRIGDVVTPNVIYTPNDKNTDKI